MNNYCTSMQLTPSRRRWVTARAYTLLWHLILQSRPSFRQFLNTCREGVLFSTPTVQILASDCARASESHWRPLVRDVMGVSDRSHVWDHRNNLRC